MTDDPDAKRITEPMEIRGGDRIALEHRIDLVERDVQGFIEGQKLRSTEFYGTRMMPLEASNAKASIRSAIALTIALVALVIAIVSGALMVVLHAIDGT